MNLTGPGGVNHAGIRFLCGIFPLRNIIPMLIQMVDGKRIAVEWSNTAQFQLPVSVKIHQYGITGWQGMNLCHRPICPIHCRRIKNKASFFTTHQSGFISPSFHLAKSVIFKHSILNQLKLQFFLSPKLIQILWQTSTIASPLLSPVILILISGFKAAN